MKGQMKTHDGQVYTLPVLLEWEIRRTGGVPCDSFYAVCLYEPAMAAVLPQVNRFRSAVEGKSVFYGVVDAYEISRDQRGTLLRLEGRGLAALLLDNEAWPVSYQRADTAVLYRACAAPYGVTCQKMKHLSGAYTVRAGASQWKALEDFTQRYGGFSPYLDKVGQLYLCPVEPEQTLTLGDGSPVLEVGFRERRYGVITEAVVVDKVRGIRHTVRNEELLCRGGSRRQILYAPARSSYDDMRYTGAYQIRASARDQRALTILLPGAFLAEPGDLAAVGLTELGVSGTYRVEQVRSRMDSGGETCLLTLKER